MGTEELDTNAATTSEGGFDLTTAGDTISADLFGGSAEVAEPSTEGEEAATAAVEGPEAPSTEAAPAAPALAAPKTWRPEAAAKFATLPPDVQQEVLKREEDMFKGLETYKADATAGKALQEILKPYDHLMKAHNVNPMQQISSLLRAHVLLATGSAEQKQQLFQQIAKDYGVNLGGEAPYVDPEVANLQKELSALKSRLQGREQQEVAQTRAKLQAELDTFAADPAHQYFDEVANDIAGLLRSGTAKDLKDAYDKAVWANPATRAKEQARLTAESAAKAKAEAEKKVQQVRKATGANVNSKAKAASGTAPLGSIDDTLMAGLAEIRSRA